MTLARTHHSWAEGGASRWVHDHHVGVEARGDAAFALGEPSQGGGRLADPPRRHPHVTQVAGQLEAAEVQRLHAGRSRWSVFQVSPFLGVSVRGVVGGHDADRAAPQTIAQS